MREGGAMWLVPLKQLLDLTIFVSLACQGPPRLLRIGRR
jgi:hypothetical protein